MPKPLPYRKASGDLALPARSFALKRYLLVPLFLIATIALIFLIAGDQAGAVFQTWVPAIFLLPILVAALMLGIAITAPFAQRNLFQNSPYPDLFRIVVSLALGLGVLALGTLLLGTLHLIQPGEVLAAAPPHLATGGHPWAPAILLFIAAFIGFIPSRTFFRSFNYLPFKKPIYPAEYLILLAAVPTAILLIAATYPPGSLWLSEGHGYDVLEYHLQLPREYAANNSTAPLAHNVYSYFPQNIEMLYLLSSQLAKFAMTENTVSAAPNGYLWGVYPSQFLHAFLMLLTAASVALTPIRLSTAARFLGFTLFLSIPWTIITGSLAYNEAGMLLYGSIALSLALDSTPNTLRHPLLGIVLGFALGCKMTAGTAFAVPVAAILLINHFSRKRDKTQGNPFVAITFTALIAAAVYSPWATRAAVYGGNPVFPLATGLLPKSDWTPEQSTRFIQAHSAKQDNRLVGLFDIPAHTAALFNQSVGSAEWSPGYASIYTWANEKPDDAFYKHVGILWVIALPAILLAFLAALRQKSPGNLTQVVALLFTLLLQFLAWMFFTHLQSRFLLPVAIPLVLLIAQGSQGLGPHVGGLPLGVLRILITTLIGLQAICAVFLLLPETDLLMGTRAQNNQPARRQAIGMLFEINLERNFAAQAEDPTAEKSLDGHRPVGKILLLGGITPLFDEGDIQYNTVFDKNPLADILKLRGARAAADYLREEHVNYVLIDWAEIARLRATIGYDDSITPAAIQSLIDQGITPISTPNFPKNLLLLQVAPTTQAASAP